jgi:hypothetical protein
VRVRGALAIAVVVLAGACGLGVTGTRPDSVGPGADAANDASVTGDGNVTNDPDGGDGGADSAPSCGPCSATCPEACGGICSSEDNVCFGDAGLVQCLNDCKNCMGLATDCTICDATGHHPFSICTNDPMCMKTAGTCVCATAKDCADDQDVCLMGKCVPCGFGGPAGGTKNLSCQCDTCDGMQCMKCN